MSQEREYNFPVFGTQGGGLVREVGRNQYIFVEAPPAGMGLGIGDHMPEQWGIIAANDAAFRMIDEEQFGADDHLVSAEDHLFDRAMAEYLHRGSDTRQLT